MWRGGDGAVMRGCVEGMVMVQDEGDREALDG